MQLAAKSLQDLTNKFIKEFLDLAHAESVKEKKESTMPQLVSDKRDDSYTFNYTLAECLVYSDFVKKNKDEDYPLVGSGFASNIVKGLFEFNIRGFNKDIMYVLENFNNQDSDLDYYFRDLKTTIKTVKEKEINTEYFMDKTKPLHVEVDNIKTTHTFSVVNNKSGYEGVCKVELTNGELENSSIFGKSSNKDHQLSIRSNEQFEKCEPTIHHFKHVADINSFFMVLDQVIYGIKDTLKARK
jgi:hypothetical protein